MMLSPAFGILTVVLGLLLCIILDTAPGATIVVVGLAIFFFVMAGRKIAGWRGR
jgi:ABC-type Mn2+/Zn2+ transport system permease subunit